MEEERQEEVNVEMNKYLMDWMNEIKKKKRKKELNEKKNEMMEWGNE